MSTTYTVNFGQDMEKEISTISQSKHLSSGEFIERAIATYVYLNKEAEAGRRVLIEDKDNNIVQEITLTGSGG